MFQVIEDINQGIHTIALEVILKASKGLILKYLELINKLLGSHIFMTLQHPV